MILRRFSSALRRQDWPALALEIVVVVLGVFIGLQVSNWNEARLEAQREALYLAALREDFVAVIAELEGDIARYEEIANAMTLLLVEAHKPAPELPLAELAAAVRLLTAMEGTPIVSDTYTNLTGSGDLAIISSQAIKNAMAAFFSKADTIELVGDTHEMQLVNIFQPYIIAHLDYVDFLRDAQGLRQSAPFAPERVLAALPTPEFRNVVAVKWDITTDLRSLLLRALTEARTVEGLLGEELAQRS